MSCGLKRRMSSSSSSSSSSFNSNSNHHNHNNHHLLDCHSLQSSLKRVRLNCSPGELRLQRDLMTLPPQVWNTTTTTTNNNNNNGSGCDGRRWILTADSNISLSLVDPLRLVLQFAGTGRIWIQIPRMYPHRPPVISRIENLWMERIVVHEIAPYSPSTNCNSSSTVTDYNNNDHHQENPKNSLIRGTTTVVFDRWSPVMHIGDLIDFCIKTVNCRPTPSPSPPLLQSSSSLNHHHQLFSATTSNTATTITIIHKLSIPNIKSIRWKGC